MSDAPDRDLLAPGLLHEMRQPLMGVLAGLELLARKLGAGTAVAAELSIVRTQAARLHEMFRTYEEVLRGTAGRAPFDVDETVRRAVDLLSFRLQALGDRFALQEQKAWAVGAHHALLHAVTNLLVNALDAVDGSDGRVQVRVLGGGPRVEIRVSDEGHGIPADVRALIFRQGFTTKEKGRGSGLGLAIARTMIERSGGELTLVSDDDPHRAPWARTEFAIRLERSEGEG